MILAFENNIGNSLRSKVMRFGSQGSITHCQFIFPFYGNVVASAWDDCGVGFKSYSETVLDSLNWHFFDLGADKDKQLYEWFRSQIGKEYDLIGLFTSFIFPVQKRQNEHTFCSELCYLACTEVLGLAIKKVNPLYLTPMELYKIIKKHYE